MLVHGCAAAAAGNGLQQGVVGRVVVIGLAGSGLHHSHGACGGHIGLIPVAAAVFHGVGAVFQHRLHFRGAQQRPDPGAVQLDAYLTQSKTSGMLG